MSSYQNINVNGSAFTSSYTISYSAISGNVLTINLPGNYVITEGVIGTAVTKPFTVKLTQSNAQYTIFNSIFNREMRFDFGESANSSLTLDGITSQSDTSELYNVYCESYHSSNNQFNITNSNFYATPTNTVVKRSRTAGNYTNNNIYITVEGIYTFGRVDAFVSPVYDITHFKIYLGQPESEYPVIGAITLVPDVDIIDIDLTFNIIGDVTISDTTFVKNLTLVVNPTKTITFANCTFDGLINPRQQLITFLSTAEGVGNINFSIENKSYFYPTLTQLQTNTMITFSAGQGSLITPTVNNVTGALFILPRQSYYNNYAIYNTVDYVKNSTLILESATSCSFGALNNTLNFNLNINLANNVSPRVAVFVNGNVTYINNSQSGYIVWSGLVKGSDVNLAGSAAFYTESSMHFDSFKIIANGGNNIANTAAQYGNFNDVSFSYYPSQYEYNLANENQYIVLDNQQPRVLELYTNVIPYKFHTDSYVKFIVTVDSGNSLNILNSEFNNKLQLTIPLNSNVNINNSDFHQMSDVSSFFISLVDSSGTLTLNNDIKNTFHYLSDKYRLVETINSPSPVINTNNYSLTPNIYNLVSQPMSNDSSLISAGTIVLNGNYGFSLSDTFRFNLVLSENSAILDSNLGQGFNYFQDERYNLTLNRCVFKILNQSNFLNYSDFITLVDPNPDPESNSLDKILLTDCDFYLPSVNGVMRKSISNYTYIENNINGVKIYLPSESYSLTLLTEPLTYSLGEIYTIPSDLDVSLTLAIDKSLTINPSGPVTPLVEQALNLHGSFAQLTLNLNSTSCKFINFSSLNITPTLNSINSLTFNKTGTNTHDFSIYDNTTVIRPSIDSYIYITGQSKVNLSLDNAILYETDFIPKYGIKSYNSGNIELNSTLIPETLYNKVYWPALASLESYTFSSDYYFAESWTNDVSHNETFLNKKTGLSKEVTEYPFSEDWDESTGYHFMPFRLAYSLPDIVSTAVLDNNDILYNSGSLYNGNDVSGTSSLIFTNNFRLRFNSDNTHLFLKEGIVNLTVDILQDGQPITGPVPFNYTITNDYEVSDYTLVCQVNPELEYVDATSLNVNVSDVTVIVSPQLRFLYRDENGSNLKFSYDTSIAFPIMDDYVITSNDGPLKTYFVTWDKVDTYSESLSLNTSPDNAEWVTHILPAFHIGPKEGSSVNDETGNPYILNTETLGQVNITLNNINLNTILLIDRELPMHPIRSIDGVILSNQLILDVTENYYSFTDSFYIMSHVLLNLSSDPLPVLASGKLFIDNVQLTTAIINITLDVEGDGSVISQLDTPKLTNITVSFLNSPQITANSIITVEISISDASGRPNQMAPAISRYNVNIPLKFYINSLDNRTEQAITETIVKGEQTNLYIYSSSTYSKTADYPISLQLTNSEKAISLNLTAVIPTNGVRGPFLIELPVDNKIIGDGILTFTSSVDFENDVSFNYSESLSHDILINFARAISNGYETSLNLSKLEYHITPITNQRRLMVPTNWVADSKIIINSTTDNIQYTPVTKYTAYMIEIALKSHAFRLTDINGINDIKASIAVYNDNGIVPSNMYVLNDNLSSATNITEISVTDLIGNAPLKRMFFKLNDNYDYTGGKILTIKLNFSLKSGTNYENLQNSYDLAQISYENVFMTTVQSASLNIGTWTLMPSTDGKTLSFYHSSKANSVLTINIDGTFSTL